jgi:tRNA threonylcarbamoyladenosine biosynthesis protein TsaE
VSGPLHGPGKPVGPRVPVHAEAARGPTVELPSVADTRALGQRLASVLRAGDLVVLTGPLGAGKTALVQGIGAGLHVRGNVVSPTFVIARVHDGVLPLVHVDAYRLSSLA